MTSRGVNKATILGYLGADPELRYMPDGTPVVSLSIATKEIWKDKDTQEQRERTEWHRAVAYNKAAETIDKYLKMGSKIYIEGRLQTRKWKDQKGIERYITEIIIREFQFLDYAEPINQPPLMGDKTAPSATDNSDAATVPSSNSHPDAQPEPPAPHEIPPGGAADFNEDDILTQDNLSNT